MKKDQFKSMYARVHDLMYLTLLTDEVLQLHCHKIALAPELENTQLEPENHVDLINLWMNVQVQNFYDQTFADEKFRKPETDIIQQLSRLFVIEYHNLITKINEERTHESKAETFLKNHPEVWKQHCELVTHQIIDLYNSYHIKKEETNAT